MLTVQNLCKYYDKNKINEQYVLKNISLELPNTGLVSIFGPSGCGKTTLLNMLAGLDNPTSGTVCYNDIPITDSFRYDNVGVIFQDYALLENKTVEENIRIGYLEAIDQVLEDTLRALDILKLKERRVSMLSGGEKQRVSIARAIIKKPAYIVADEPTGNLDLKNRMRVMQILKSLSTHMLIILVSHDIELVTKYSDRIITLTDGQVTEDKTLSALESKTNHEAIQRKMKFNLSTYLKDTFQMKNKTNFMLILFMIALTILVCLCSSNITGYKYQSSYLPNQYIRFEKTLSLEAFEKIQNKGAFQYDPIIQNFHLPQEKEFLKLEKMIYIKDYQIKLYPYQNEEILYAMDMANEDNTPKVYLTTALAKRLLKEGKVKPYYTSVGYVTLEKIYFQNIKDFLGSRIFSRGYYEVIGIADSDVEGILYSDSYFITKNGTVPYSIYKKYNPEAPQIENENVLVLGKSTTSNKIGEEISGLGPNDAPYKIQDIYDDILSIDGNEVLYVVNDYNYYEANVPRYFYTENLEEVTSILDTEKVLYELPAVEIYKEIDTTLKKVNIIFLAATIVLLFFRLFFILLYTWNYMSNQIFDIIIF
ncbi:MAG: ABC transporter ATP-binding protein [Anaeroplasmataceae bacterium]|nr:ABC transporter ATP-binding protein [Anaeroplasmataceae bacterium]